MDRNEYCGLNNTKVAISEISSLPSESEQNKAVAVWFRDYMSQGEITEAIDLLEAIPTKVTKRKLIPFKLEANDFTAVGQLLSELPIESLEDQNFNAYYQLLLNIRESNRDYFVNLTENEINTLVTIANSKTKTAFDAQTHLRIADLVYYPIDLPDLSLLPHNQGRKKSVISSSTIATVSSNPIKDSGIISYNLPTNGTAILHIFDITGKKIREEKIQNKGIYRVGGEDFSNGLYIYTISFNQEILHREKIIIAR